MATNKTMEDWFLRGGEKPQDNGMQTVAVAVCQNCGHENPASEEICKHCLAPLVGEPSTAEICGDDEYGDDEYGDDEREFEVTMSRYRTVKQMAYVTIKADCEESAMEKAEALAEDNGDVWDWEDVEDSEDIKDVAADEAEEL